jgi:hypothetical protein
VFLLYPHLAKMDGIDFFSALSRVLASKNICGSTYIEGRYIVW